MDLDSEQQDLLKGVLEEAVALFLTFTVLMSAFKWVAKTTSLNLEFPSYMAIALTGFLLASATLLFKGWLAVREPSNLRDR